MYSYLKKKKRSDTFENIWNDIASKSDVTVHGASKEDVITELYTDLVLDNRFVFFNFVLILYKTLDKIKKIINMTIWKRIWWNIIIVL